MNTKEITSRLNFFGDGFGVRNVIAQTIARLPDEVAEWLLSHCRFLPGSDGERTHMVCCHSALKRKATPTRDDYWDIMLPDNLQEDNIGFVANLCAHAYLGFYTEALVFPSSTNADQAAQAANLAKEWGFTGHWTDAARCSAPYLPGPLAEVQRHLEQSVNDYRQQHPGINTNILVQALVQYTNTLAAQAQEEEELRKLRERVSELEKRLGQESGKEGEEGAL